MTRRWYVSSENEMVRSIAAKLGVDAAELVSLNLTGEHALGAGRAARGEGRRLPRPPPGASPPLPPPTSLPLP